MILPSKHIPISHCLLNSGAKILGEMKSANTISSLWEKARNIPEVLTFEKYVITLSLLYTLGVIEISNGLIRRKENDIVSKM